MRAIAERFGVDIKIVSRIARTLHKLPRPARGESDEWRNGTVLTADEARLTQDFYDRPTQVQRQRDLAAAREKHAAWLASMGIASPAEPIIVPETKAARNSWLDAAKREAEEDR